MSNNDDEKGDERQRYRLTVPLDASELEELREEKPQDLQVVGRLPDGTSITETVALEQGEGVAELEFEDRPDGVGVFVGPDRATAEELVKSQTITANLPGERWVDTPEVELDPIRIPAYHWDWWYHWCREFVIRGRLECPNGSPVPGAKVCAKDVDAFFIWSSTEQVGCDTTDEHGAFEIRFRWCCGFWPRWWWHNRAWRPDPVLVDQLRSVIDENPDLSVAHAGTQPGLEVFADLLDDQPLSLDQSLPELDPNRLEQIRSQLTERLPDVPELRRLHVWPWVQWQPWWDCIPDIIFEATQDGDVVLDEGIEDTRWSISNPESVVLTANEEAMCTDCQTPPCEGGECLLVTQICDATPDRVGGNHGAGAPPGYLDPGSPAVGAAAHAGDRPFAENVSLSRNFGPIENVDYFEFEVNDGSSWKPIGGEGETVGGEAIGGDVDVAPPDAVEDLSRKYYDETNPDDHWPSANFDFQRIDRHYVMETREHYERTNDPPSPLLSWEKRWDSDTGNLLVRIDSTAFDDGTYRFRVVGWEETDSGDGLTNGRVLARCPEEDQTPVEVVLTFDNRFDPEKGDPAHPLDIADPHPCGEGTVHECTTEPDTDIISVKVNDNRLKPCDIAQQQDGTLTVDFLAHDPDGHLSHYTLQVTFEENRKLDLLSLPSSEINPIPSESPAPPYPGPEYGQALEQGATRPEWKGGRYRLTVDLDQAFPIPCCYQLELRAWKRSVVNCTVPGSAWNLSEYMIGFGV